MQSSTFNLGIVIGSALGGAILDYSSIMQIVYLTIALLIVPILLSLFSKKTLWRTNDDIITTEQGKPANHLQGKKAP